MSKLLPRMMPPMWREGWREKTGLCVGDFGDLDDWARMAFGRKLLNSGKPRVCFGCEISCDSK